jgi:hypothetical protein
MRVFSFRSPISIVAVLASCALGLGLATSACTVGDSSQVDRPSGPQGAPSSEQATFTDDDGDGIADSVDRDGDGVGDYTIADCDDCGPSLTVVCRRPFIDLDGDGFPEGLDRNCDGKIDIYFGTHPGTGGGTGGTGGRCTSTSTINGVKFAATCEGNAGGGLSCSCKKNDVQISTCTQASTTCATSAINGKVKAACCVF